MNTKGPRSSQRSRNPKQLQLALRRMLREAAQLQAEAEEMKKRTARMVREVDRHTGFGR